MLNNKIPEQVDITEPEIVEIQISHDGTVVWVNVEGICMFRACRIKALVLDDGRQGGGGIDKRTDEQGPEGTPGAEPHDKAEDQEAEADSGRQEARRPRSVSE